MAVSSVAILLQHPTDSDKFLGIKKFTRLDKVGLPAGKLLKNEKSAAGIIRECSEETGITPVVIQYLGTRYTKKTVCDLYAAISFEGNLATTTPEGIPGWFPRNSFCDDLTSFFSKWNTWAFENYDLFYDAIAEGNMQVSSGTNKAVRRLILQIEQHRLQSIRNGVILNLLRSKLSPTDFSEFSELLRCNKLPANVKLLNIIDEILINVEGSDSLFMRLSLYRFFSGYIETAKHKHLLNQVLIHMLEKKQNEKIG